MATTKKQKINFYMKYATQNLILAIDDHSMHCRVISETVEGVSYRVEMDEATMTAKSCSCAARGACKHLTVANTLQYKVVAPVEEAPVAEPVVEETTIFEVERKSWYIVGSRHQVWLQDGTWMCASGAEFVEMVKAHLGIQDEPEAAQVERATYWDKDQCCRCYVATRQPVDPEAQQAKLQAQNEAWNELIELEDQMSIVKKRDMMDAPLTRNSGFNLLAS